MSEVKKKQWLKMLFVAVLGAVILVADFWPFIQGKFYRSIEVPEWVTTDYILFFLGLVLMGFYPIKWVLIAIGKKLGINTKENEKNA